VIPSSLRYALPGSSMCLHLHLPSSPPRTTTERLCGVANITQPARGATARGPMQHPCPRRCGAACWVWLRSGSATSPPPRIITMWSRLPDGMDDFPWRRSGCGDAEQRGPGCGHADVGTSPTSGLLHRFPICVVRGSVPLSHGVSTPLPSPFLKL
jgi:hypothetical protein